MGRFARGLLLGGLAMGGLAAPAQAQYYDYEAPRPYVEGPPPGYRAPSLRPGRELGGRCRVRLRTDIGRTRYVCPIVRAKAIGRPCGCPPPRGARGPFLDGVVIR